MSESTGRFYKLLINGEDVDTGKYEYCPKADKLIEAPEATLSHVRSLKRTQDSCEYDNKYISAKYCIADDVHVEDAIKAANSSHQLFKHFSVSKRVKIIRDIRQSLVSHKDELLQLFVEEGHPISLAAWEIEGMLAGLSSNTVEYFKSQLRTEIASGPGEKVYLLRKADGVVCLIPPRNAPCSNSCTAVLALLPGNSLIVKPPLRNPVSTLFFWREIVFPALMANGAPPGLVNLVVGNSTRILDTWLKSELVNDIIFFGDSERGEKIGQKIFSSNKKPILELSGNDILVVWKDANIVKAVDSACDAFLGSSQICMVPKIILVHPLIYQEFLTQVLEKVKRIKAGLPSDPNVHLTPIGRLDEFKSVLSDAVKRGAKVRAGGQVINWKNEVSATGSFVEATVLSIDSCDRIYDYDCIRHEGFFPLLPIVNVASSLFKNNDDLIAEAIINIVNNNDYGLRFSIWIESDRYLRRFIKYVDNAGIFRVNSKHVGFSDCLGTHGGTKKSGGPFGEMNYFWQKTSHLQGVSRTKI